MKNFLNIKSRTKCPKMSHKKLFKRERELMDKMK